MKIINKIYPAFLIALLCAVIIFIWFKEGKLLATGEDSLILINPDRALELYKYSWNEVRSGVSSPGWNSMILFFYAESFILRIGMPVWLFQAMLYFVLMLIGSLSVYYLSKELFKDIIKDRLKIQLGLFAALFYILNPVSLLTIWYRGIAVHSFIFFYALAPLFFYFYLIGIKYRKLLFIIITPLLTLFFSPAFASPSEPLLLWFFPFLYSLTLTLVDSPSKFKIRILPIVYFTAVFVVWILINLWWIFPYIEFSKIVYFADKNTLGHAINTLKANSNDFTLDNVIRLIHGGFLYRNEAFGPIYKNPIFIVISWLIPIVTIYGLLKLRHGQIKLFFAISLTLLIFVAKGTSFPFGGVFLWLFSHIGILQIFRNPFEKFGMLMPLIYAPLFSFGLVYLLNKTQDFKKRTLLFVLAFTFLAIFHWPFFSGALVSFGGRDIKVEVPASFESANEQVLSFGNKVIEADNHVILSIPVMGGASGFYKWEYGFKGVDASPYLFNHPVINIFYDSTSFSGQMLVGFSNGFLNNLTGMAQFFSADIVAYRKDTDISAFGYNLDALERTEKMIKDFNLKKIFDSNEVSLWMLPEDKIVPVIYTPNVLRLGDSPKELISLLENKQFDPKQEAFICINEDKCNPYLKQDLSLMKIDVAPEKLEVTKVSPVNYQIKVYNSQGKFLLVFNNNYHPGWVASIEDQPVSKDKHIVANGYANGFIIDRTGNFDISLRFTPEEVVQKSYRVSLIVISLGAIILLGSTFKKLITK